MIKCIPESDWPEIAGILEDEIGAYVPDPGQAKIPAIIEDGELLALCVAEKFLRCDNFWVAERVRGTHKAAALIRQLAKYLFNVVPHGTSGVIIAANENQGRLFKKLGFRQVPGTLYAINIE